MECPATSAAPHEPALPHPFQRSGRKHCAPSLVGTVQATAHKALLEPIGLGRGPAKVVLSEVAVQKRLPWAEGALEREQLALHRMFGASWYAQDGSLRLDV